MSILDRIRDNKNKFMTTVILIIISATAINYGLYSILDTYFNSIDSIYKGIQLNMILTVLVISIVTIVMFVLMPKQAVNDLFYQLDHDHAKTNEQILQEMIDDELEKEEEKL